MNPQMPGQVSPINMALIRQAMAQRMAGNGMPSGQQITPPSGLTPVGQPNGMPGAPSPIPAMPPQSPVNLAPPMPGAGAVPGPAGQAIQGAQGAQGPAFDDETKKLAKPLIMKLLGVL